MIGITKEKLYMFTDIEKCKSCNNPVLNALIYNSKLFDSLDIEYEVILKCKRKRDLEDYRHYNNLNDSLKIVALNDSITKLYDPKSTQAYFVLTRNDTIYFATERLESLIDYIIE
jgi:hypothetical protein